MLRKVSNPYPLVVFDFVGIGIGLSRHEVTLTDRLRLGLGNALLKVIRAVDVLGLKR